MLILITLQKYQARQLILKKENTKKKKNDICFLQ